MRDNNVFPPTATTFGMAPSITTPEGKDCYLHWLDVRLSYEKVRWKAYAFYVLVGAILTGIGLGNLF